MVDLNKIKIKLKEAITLSGMTQQKLADSIGVAQPSIARYKSGKGIPSLDTFANLCAVLDLDSEDILCIKDFANDIK